MKSKVLLALVVALALLVTLVIVGVAGTRTIGLSGGEGEPELDSHQLELRSAVAHRTLGAREHGVDAGTVSRRGRTFHLLKRTKAGDPICRLKRRKFDNPGRCKRVTVTKATAKYRPTVPERQRMGWAQGDEGWCREWWTQMRGIYYVNWAEKHQGKFCWIEGPSAPNIYQNNWKCNYNHGIGYSVSIDDCWDEIAHGDTTHGYWVAVYDKFKVSFAFKGFPFSRTYQFHTNLHPTGYIGRYIDK